MDTIGSRIKEYRLQKGMTQQDIADALGESSGRVIYNWEKGIGRPDCDKLAKLCDLLGVSADELIGCKSMAQRPTATEWNTLQKYRALDEHGKEVVDYMIDSEYKRVTARYFCNSLHSVAVGRCAMDLHPISSSADTPSRSQSFANLSQSGRPMPFSQL